MPNGEETSVIQTQEPTEDEKSKSQAQLPDSIDYWPLRIYEGMNDDEISEFSQLMQTPVSMSNDPEALYNDYKEWAPNNEMPDDPKSFMQIFGDISNQYSEYKTKVYQAGSPSVWGATAKSRFFRPLVDKYGQALAKDPQIREEHNFMFDYTDEGRLKQVRTAEQNATNQNVYFQVEDDGSYTQRALEDDLHKWDYDASTAKGEGVRYGLVSGNYEKYGESTILNLEYDVPDREGEGLWVERPMTNELKRSAIRSHYGDQEMYNGYVEAFWESFMGTVVGGFPQVVGSMTENIGEALKTPTKTSLGIISTLFSGVNLNRYIFDEDKDPDVPQDNLTDKWGNYLQNLGAQMRDKPALTDELSGFMDSPSAFTTSAGQVAGNLAQMMITRKSLWGAYKPQTVNKIAKGTLAFVAADGTHAAADEAEIPDSEKPWLFAKAFMITYAAESIMNQDLLTKGFSSHVAKGAVRKDMMSKVGDYLARIGKKSMREATPGEVKGFTSFYTNGLSKQWKKFIESAPVRAIGDRAPLPIKAAAEESIEEVFENIGHNSMMIMHDAFKKIAGEGGLNPDYYQYYVEDGNFYRRSLMDGSERRISEETFNKEVELKKLQPGKGLFGEYNPSHGFISNYSGRVGEGMFESMVMGAFAGGFMGGFSGLTRKRAKLRIIQDYVVQGRSEELRGIYKDMSDKGDFGPRDIGIDGVSSSQENPSVNDIMYQRALEDLELSEKLLKSVGIGDYGSDISKAAEMLRDLGTGGEEAANSMVLTAVENASEQYERQERINEIQEILKDPATPAAEAEKHNKDIEDLQGEINNLKLDMEDIKSGKRFKETFINRATKAQMDRNPASVPYTMPDGKKSYIKANQMRTWQKNYNTSKEAEIERIREASEERMRAETEITDVVSEINKMDAEKMDVNLLQRIAAIQKAIGEVGMSQAKSQEILNALESKRQEIIEAIPKAFEEEFAEDFEKIKEADVGVGMFEMVYPEAKGKKEGTRARSAVDLYENIEEAIGAQPRSERRRVPKEGQEQEYEELTTDMRNAAHNIDAFDDINVFETEYRMNPEKWIDNAIEKNELMIDKMSRDVDDISDENERKEANAKLLKSKEQLENIKELKDLTARRKAVSSISEQDITGRIPSEFNEDRFKTQYFGKYYSKDKKGNDVLFDIDAYLDDFLSSDRQFEEEDLEVLNRVEKAIENNIHISQTLAGMDRVLGKDVDKALRDYRYDEALRIKNARELAFIKRGLAVRQHTIEKIKDDYAQAMNDKKARQRKINHEEVKKRSFVINIATEFPSDSKESELLFNQGEKLLKLNEELNVLLDEKTYFDKEVTSKLIEVDAELISSESTLHGMLNGNESEALIEHMTEHFRVIKGKSAGVKYTSYLESFEFNNNDYDQVATANSFISQDVDSKQSQYSRIYFQNYINSLKKLDPKDFYKEYRKITDAVTPDGGIIPSYEQELLAYHGVAFLSSADNSALLQMEELFVRSKETVLGKTGNFNSLLLRAFAGTGKTNVMINLVLDVYNKLYGKPMNILAVAPSLQLQQDINNNIRGVRANKDSSYDMAGIMEMISLSEKGKGDGLKGIDLIVVDEAQTVRDVVLREFHQKLNDQAQKHGMGEIKVLFFGDPSQISHLDQRVGESVAVERVMQRTMPLTEVFRSGDVGISSYQNALRQVSSGIGSESAVALLPVTTFDSARYNGLEYMDIPRRDMYDKFGSDLNSEDQFISDNTYLIVLNEKHRQDAIAKVLSNKNNTKSVDFISERVKYIDSGDHSASGLELPRVFVAIERADAGNVYNKIMLTAVTRAAQTEPSSHDKEGELISIGKNGYAAVIGDGVSTEGEPIIVQIKTNSKDDIEHQKSRMNAITGEKSAKTGAKSRTAASDVQEDETSTMTSVTYEDFSKTRKDARYPVKKSNPSRIVTAENKTLWDKVARNKFRYLIKGKGILSVTEKLDKSIKGTSAINEAGKVHGRAAMYRGNIIHKIVEVHLNSTTTEEPELSDFDVKYLDRNLDNYNKYVDKNNSYDQNMRMQKIDQSNLTAKEGFVNYIIENVAKPIADQLNEGGKYTLPETVVGIYYNDIAGTIDIIDVVGYKGKIPVVDIWDIKTKTPRSFSMFGNADGRVGFGEFKIGAHSRINNPKNKAFLQLASYKKILESGDPVTGTPKFIVRNINVVAVALDGKNDVVSMKTFSEDTESKEFKAQYGIVGDELVQSGQWADSKAEKIHDLNHPLINTHWTERDGDSGAVHTVTGAFSQAGGEFIVINGNEVDDGPVSEEEFRKRFIERSYEPEQKIDPEKATAEAAKSSSAVMGADRNKYISPITASTTKPGEGETVYNHNHALVRNRLLEKLQGRISDRRTDVLKLDLMYYDSIALQVEDAEYRKVADADKNTDGSVTYRNVLLTRVKESEYPLLIASIQEILNVDEAEAKRLIKEQGFDVVSTLYHADADIARSKITTNADMLTDGESLLNEISNGFKEHEHRQQLRHANKKLTALRIQGAKNLKETGENLLDEVKVFGIKPGKVIYHSDNKKKVFSKFLEDIEKQGLKAGKPYFDNAIYTKTDDQGNTYSVAGFVVDVWQFDSNKPSRVILRAPMIRKNNDAAAEKKRLLEDVANLKSATFSEVYNSLGYKFLAFNQSYFLDRSSGRMAEDVGGLSEYIYAENGKLKIKGDEAKKTSKAIPVMTKNLKAAIEFVFEDVEKAGSNIADVRMLVGFTSGKHGRLDVPEKAYSKLETAATEAYAPSLYLGLDGIDTSEQFNDDALGNDAEANNGSPPVPNFNISTDPHNGDIDYFAKSVDEIESDTPQNESEPEIISNEALDNEYTDYGALRNVFADSYLIKKVKGDVAGRLLHFSNLNPNPTIPVKRHGKIIKDVQDNYIAMYEGMNDAQKERADEINASNIHKADQGDITLYSIMKLATDEAVLLRFIQKIQPDINISKYVDKRSRDVDLSRIGTGQKIQSDIESKSGEEFERLSGGSEVIGMSHIIDSNDELKATETMSSNIHLAVDNLELGRYKMVTAKLAKTDLAKKRKWKIGDIVAVNLDENGFSTDPRLSRKVNPSFLHKELVIAWSMSIYPTSDQIGMDRIERAVDNLRRAATFAGLGTVAYDSIMSFVDKYMNVTNIKDTDFHRYTPAYLDKNVNEVAAIGGLNENTVREKAEKANELISAFFTHYGSIQPKRNLSVDVLPDRTYRTNKTYSKIGEVIKEQLKQRIDNTIFTITDGGMSVKSEFKDKFVGNDRQWRVDQSGVYDTRSGKDVLMVKITKEPGGKIRFGFDKDSAGGIKITDNDAKRMLNVFGMKELINLKTMSEYLQTESDTQGRKSYDKIEQEMLAELIGAMFITAQYNISENSSVAEMVLGYFKAGGKDNPYTNRFNIKPPLDELPVIDGDQNAEIATKGRRKNRVRPSGLFHLLENLATAQASVSGNDYLRHFYTVKNARVYMDTNSSTIYQTFPAAIRGRLPHEGVQDKFNNEIISLIRDAKGDDQEARALAHQKLANNPLLSEIDIDAGTYKILNAVLDKTSGFAIHEVFETDGLRMGTNSTKYGADMRENDLLEMSFNGLFAEDLLKRRRVQRFLLPYHNMGERSRIPAFDVQLSNDANYPIIKINSEGEITIDHTIIDREIERKFDYHHNARSTSLYEWGRFFSDFTGQSYTDNVESWIKSENTEKDPGILSVFDTMNNTRSVEFFDAVRADTELTKNKDYIIRDGKIVPGKGTMMDVDNVYSMRNYNKLKAASSEEKRDVIDKLFHDRHMKAASLFYENNFEFHPGLNLESNNTIRQVGEKEWKPIPILEAYFYLWHIADSNISQVVQGDTTNYSDISDYFKRSANYKSPGWTGNTVSPTGMGATLKIAIISDILHNEGEPTAYRQLRDIFGYKESYNESDGLGIVSPLSLIRMKRSVGGELGIIEDGMLKPQYAENDLSTNNNLTVKYALLNLSDETLINSEIARGIFKKMHGQEVHDYWWNDGKPRDMKDVLTWVEKQGLAGTYVDQAVFESAVKSGVRNIKNINDEDWRGTEVTMNTEYFRIQLNPSQDITKTGNNSGPSQPAAQIGIGDHNTKLANDLYTELAQENVRATKEMADEFTDGGVFNKDKFADYLRKISQEGDQEFNMYQEIVQDASISLNIPTFRVQAMQKLLNKVKKEAVLLKWNGLRYNQAPGFMFKLIEHDGVKYMENEARGFGIEGEGEALQPMKFFSNEEMTAEIMTAEDYGALLEKQNNSGEQAIWVKAADVIIPFSYLKQFRIPENTSLNEVFVIVGPDGPVNLRKMSDDKMRAFLEGVYAKPDEHQGHILNLFPPGEAAKETEISKKLKESGLATGDPNIEKIISYVENLNKTLNLYVSRIPSSSTASGFIGEVVGWINDNGNTAYISAAKNILDGSDYDIDALSIYFPSVNDAGEVDDSTTNRAIETMRDYYKDANNAEMYMSPINLTDMRNAVNQKVKGDYRFSDSMNDFGSNVFYYDKIQEGSRLIDIFANTSKAYSLLAHANNQMLAKGQKSVVGFELSPDGKNANGEYIINILSKYLNAALDNAKELILGTLGANQAAGNIMGAMAIRGMSVEAVVGFLNRPAIRDVFDKIKRSYSVRYYGTMDVLEAINEIQKDIERSKNKITERITVRNREIETLLLNHGDNIALATSQQTDDGSWDYMNVKEHESAIQSEILKLSQELAENNKILAEPSLLKEEYAPDLEQLRDLAMLGEALNRFSAVSRVIGPKGLKVEDYEIYRQVKNIENAFSMSLSDFARGKSDENWRDYLLNNVKKYLDNSPVEQPKEGPPVLNEQEMYMEQEAKIRAYINVTPLIRALPHVDQGVKTLDNMVNNWFAEGFVDYHPVMKKTQQNFLDRVKRDAFTFSSEYYAYTKERSSFLTALYFTTTGKNKRFVDLGDPSVTYDMTTPEGRYSFGMEFPAFALKLFKDVVDKHNKGDVLSEEETDLYDNPYLRRLSTDSRNSGDFLTFSNSSQLTNDDYIDLRNGFKRLPEHIKSRFRAYILSKDGFKYHKGGLQESLDNKLFHDYSIFLDEVTEALDDSGYVFEKIDRDGKKTWMTLSDSLNNVFNRDVGFYADKMILLRKYNSSTMKEGINLPLMMKKQMEKGAYNVDMLIFDINDKEGWGGRTKRTFNPYDPFESMLTQTQVLRNISNHDLKELMKGNPVDISFEKNVNYNRGEIHIPNGELKNVVYIKNNVMRIAELPGKSEKMNRYYMAETKGAMLDLISKLSDNEAHKELAKGMIAADAINQIRTTGTVKISDNDSDSILNAADERGDVVFGYYDRRENRRNIVLNKSTIKGDVDLFEQSFLHEISHDYINDALNDNIPVEQLTSAQLVFRNDMSKLYDEARKIAGKRRKVKRFEGAWKNKREFAVYASVNPEFQQFLKDEEATEVVPEENFITRLYDKFIDAVRRLFGISDTKNSYTMLDQVLGVIGRYMDYGEFQIKTSEGDIDFSNTKTGKYSSINSDLANQVRDHLGGPKATNEIINRVLSYAKWLDTPKADKKHDFSKSKIRNEDGTLKIMWHKSFKKISEIHPVESGIYFTPNKPPYAGTITNAAFLNSSNPFNVDALDKGEIESRFDRFAIHESSIVELKKGPEKIKDQIYAPEFWKQLDKLGKGRRTDDQKSIKIAHENTKKVLNKAAKADVIYGPEAGFENTITTYVAFGPESVVLLHDLFDVTNKFEEKIEFDSGIDFFHSTSKKKKPVEEVKDMREYLQNPDESIRTYESYREDELVNAIYRKYNKAGGKYSLNGEIFSFDESLGEEAVKNRIRNEIIPEFTKYERNYKSSTVDWLNDGARDTKSIRYFGSRSKTRDVPIYDGSVLATLRKKMNYIEGSTYMLYSDLQKGGYENIPYLPVFKGYDPIIAVHRSKGSPDTISVYDITSNPLSTRGVSDHSNLLSNWITDTEAKKRGIDLGNNEGDIRRLYLGLLMLSMKNTNADIKIKDVMVLNMQSRQVPSASVFMEADMLRNLHAMKGVDGFIDILPEEIKKLFNDDLLLKTKWEQPWMSMLRNLLEEQKEYASELGDFRSTVDIKRIDDTIGEMEAVLNGDGSKQHLKEMLRFRISELTRRLSESEMAESKEYQYAAGLLVDLERGPTFEVSKLRDLGTISREYTNSHDIENDQVKLALRKIMDGKNMISEYVMKFEDEFNEELEPFSKRYYARKSGFGLRIKERLPDMGGDRFRHLFKTAKVRDKDGNDVVINTNMIHWNANDEETKKAKISKDDLKFGKFLADRVEAELIKNIQHDRRWDKDFTKDDARKELYDKRKYVKGMMPAMTQNANELLFKRDFRATFGKVWNKMKDLNDVFDEAAVQMNQERKDTHMISEVVERFTSQFNAEDAEGYGSRYRMKIMGLRENMGEIELDDINANDNLTTNLETLVKYLVASGENKRIMESRVLPYVNSAHMMLATINAKGVSMKNNIKYLKDYSDRVVHNRSRSSDQTVMGKNIDPVINLLVTTTTFTGLALNVPVAITSGIMNSSQFWNNALANDFAGSDLYGKKEAAKILKLWASSPHARAKIEALMGLYQVIDRGERDLLHHPLRSKTRKTYFTSHHFHKLHWYTDYYVRALVMGAQMLKDGTWEAHSIDGGKLKYDVKKDKRFYKAGRMTEDGKLLHDDIRRVLIEDDIMEESEKTITRAYDYKEARRLKWIADKYITGSYDATTYANIDGITLARLFTQYKKWLPAKVHDYFGSEKYSDVGGRRTIKDVDGQKEVAWEQRVQQGIIISFAQIAKEMATEGKHLSLREWKEMPEHRKRNMMKLGMDILVGAMLVTLYNGLTGDWDDEEAMVKDSRFMRVFKYAAADVLLFLPGNLAAIIGEPFPAVSLISRLTEVATGNFGGLTRIIPAGSSVEAVAEVLPEE